MFWPMLSQTCAAGLNILFYSNHGALFTVSSYGPNKPYASTFSDTKTKFIYRLCIQESDMSVCVHKQTHTTKKVSEHTTERQAPPSSAIPFRGMNPAPF